MNAIAWNCRGLGNSRTVRELSDLVRLYHPKLVAKSSLSSVGLSGGIALYWDESISVTLLEQGECFFDILIKESPDQPSWRATFVYGEPRVENRRAIWEGPWLVMGDFNEAMWQLEHFSETPRAERQMLDFRERGQRKVRVRLDRGVANPAWLTSFPNAYVTHVHSSCSDHKVLVLRHKEQQGTVRANLGFRYEIMWERDENLGIEIGKAWERRNLGSDLEKLRKEIADLEWEDPVRNREAIVDKDRTLNEILYREEMMWLQRSRISWLREGDRNTNFFHRKAMWRAKKNRVKKLRRYDGSWCSDQAEMCSMTTDYFMNLFSADPGINFGEIVDLFQQSVTEEMNNDLVRLYSDEEIGDALHQIGPLKGPGPDGMPA
ncbi:hypothetical protein BS78_02G207000 [Paspalum vaginatum]|nr:hypothetical protein BS78_02G207000 [Paspalum vaginatum]